MKKVIDAAKRNDVAIEINNRYKLPGKAFLQMAKEAGCKFSWGTNNGGARDLGRCEYSIQMTKECGLRWQDIFVPRPVGERAIDRKGKALKA
jgi:histidinol phosphatase-like PHP family hydrolase